MCLDAETTWSRTASARRRATCSTSVGRSADRCRACSSSADGAGPPGEGRWTPRPDAGQYAALCPRRSRRRTCRRPIPSPRRKPLLEAIEKRNAAVASAREAATKDGAVVKHDPKYRTARKKLKRAQRRLRGELIRVHNVPVKAVPPPPEPAPPPTPAAAPEPEAVAAPAEAAEPAASPERQATLRPAPSPDRTNASNSSASTVSFSRSTFEPCRAAAASR